MGIEEDDGRPDPRRPPRPAPEPDPAVVDEPQLRRPAPKWWAVSPGLRDMMLGAFFFSLMSLFVKLAGRTIPTNEIVLVRAVITLAITWLVLKRAGTRVWGNNRKLLALRGLAGFLALTAVYYSFVHLPLAEATVIQYTNPVFTALLAAWWLKERLSPADAALAAVGLAGVVVVARPAFLFGGLAAGLEPFAVGVALFGAAFSAVAYVLVRKLRATEEPMVVVFYFAFVSVIGALPLALPVLRAPTPIEWLVLLGVGVTTQLGQTFLTRGLHRESAGRATAVGYVQIVFATAWGAFFFGALPDVYVVLGAALVIGSTLMIVRRTQRERLRDAPDAA